MQIHGIQITLINKTISSYDTYNQPVFALTAEIVDDVLVGEPTTQEIQDNLNLYGKYMAYMLGIPKGDTHEWTDSDVIIFGERYHTFGPLIQGIEANVPTRWHKKIGVFKYE